MFYKKSLLVMIGLTLTLAGWGCTQTNQTPVTSGEEKTPDVSVDTLMATESTPETPCPEDMTRFWGTKEYGDGMTFCYYTTTADGQEINLKNFGDKVVLYPENPNFNHSILWERLKNGDLSIEEKIAARYMTDEERAACEVMAAPKNTDWTEYLIASNERNLDAQEKCGEFRYGSFFYSSEKNPETLFFVMIGQDTFMPSNDWLETLEFVDSIKNQSPTVAPANNFVNQLSVYKNKEAGISFSYPTDWGPIISGVEMGYPNGDDGAKLATCKHQLFLELTGIDSGLFLAADNTGDCGPAGRGGWFGDQAAAFTDWDKINEWCQTTGDECEIFTNQNGLEIAHVYDKGGEVWGEVLQDLDFFALYNPTNGELPGVIIGNERLITTGLGRSEKELRNLVDSIKFE